MFKPLKVADIGGTSVMVVPPVSPKPADIGAWVTLTGYARGAIIQNAAGVLYWAVVAGTTGAAAPTHTDGDAADGTVTWRVVRRRRNTLTLVNMQAVVVSLAPGHAAVAGQGIPLTAAGSAYNDGFSDRPAYQGAWYAIAASGSTNELAVQEM